MSKIYFIKSHIRRDSHGIDFAQQATFGGKRAYDFVKKHNAGYTLYSCRIFYDLNNMS